MNEQENLALKKGYLGEKRRDASSSIRGFVYQNLLAIEELIKEETERVFCEYIEDVTSVDKNGNCKIIQAKYYSSTLPRSMEKEVFREMYCQYLKLTQDGNLNMVFPVMSVFSPENKILTKPDKDTAITWVENNSLQTISNNLSESDLLKMNKEERENAVIELYGSQDKLNEYYNAYKVEKREEDLGQLRKKLGAALVNLFAEQLEESSFELLDNDEQESILLGTSYLIILETFDRIIEMKEFEEDDRILQHKEIKRGDFIARLNRHIGEYNDSILIETVQSMIMEVFFSVLASNMEFNEKQFQIFEAIVYNTTSWIGELLADSIGQRAFYNTVSFESFEKTEKFPDLSIKKREKALLKCFPGIKSFMKYLWKIMMNICDANADFDFYINANLLNPRYYIVESEKDYICFKFEKDFVNSSIILPSVNADEGKEKRIQIYSRMYNLKPEKWFMGGDSNKYGLYDYKFSPSEIIDDLCPISSIREESDYFYLECMECIGIDKGDWTRMEECEKCIFSKECMRGKV